MKVFTRFWLFFAVCLYGQTDLLSSKVIAVLEIEDIKYYRLESAQSTPFPSKEYSGLISKTHASEYDAIVLDQTLSGNFSQFHRYQSVLLTSPHAEHWSCTLIKLRLVNTLHLEVKTLFALLHWIGQEQSEILFHFLDPLKTYSTRLGEIEQGLTIQLHGAVLSQQKDLLALWQEIEDFTKTIEDTLKESQLESHLLLMQQFLLQFREKKQAYFQLAQNEYLLQDSRARQEFLKPFEDRGNAMIVAEIKQLTQKVEPLSAEYSKQKEAFFKKQEYWGQQFLRAVLTVHQSKKQKRFQQLQARQKELQQSKAEREQLAQQLTQCESDKKEFFELQRELQNTETLSSEFVLIQEKLHTLEKTKESVSQLRQERTSLDSAEDLLQKALAELARCEQTQQEITLLDKDRLRLQKETEPLKHPQSEKIQELEALIQEKKNAKETREALKEKQNDLEQRWNVWNQRIQQWETQQKPIWDASHEKQKQLEQERQQLPMALYQEIPLKLEKLVLAKNRLPLVEHEINQCNSFKKRWSEIQPQFEQNRENLLKLQQDQQELQQNKSSLEQEFTQLQRSLDLSQQNQNEIRRFFSAYLKEIETLRKQYQQHLQENPIPAVAPLESKVPEEIRNGALKETTAQFYALMWLRLVEACHYRLFLTRHPWLQTDELKNISEAYQQELQKIEQLRAFVHQKLQTLERAPKDVSWDLPNLTPESWEKEFLVYASLRQSIQEEIQTSLNTYKKSRENLLALCPEAAQEVAKEILEFFYQASVFPTLELDRVTFTDLEAIFYEYLFQRQMEIGQKQKDLEQTLQEVASTFQMQQDLQQKILHKKYLIALISTREEETQRNLQEVQTQQEKLQTEYETLSVSIQVFPQLEAEREQLTQQLKTEPELQEKEHLRQELLRQEKEISRQIEDIKASIQSLTEAQTQYLQDFDQRSSMEKIAIESQQMRLQIEQIPQLETDIKQAEHQIEDLQKEIKMAQNEWQKKGEQLRQLEEKRQLLQQILDQEHSWKEQRQNLETQIQRKLQIQIELEKQEKFLQEEPSWLTQKELFQKKIQIRENQLKRLDSLQSSVTQEKDLRARFDSYGMLDSLLSEMEQQLQKAQQELEQVANQIAQIPQ